MSTSSFTLTSSEFKYSIGWYFGIPFRILGGFFMLNFIFQLINGISIVPVILMVLGVYLFFTRNAVDVNFKDKTMRYGPELFGIKLTKAKPFPAVEYVSIFPTKLGRKTTSYYSNSSVHENFTEVRVNLIHNRNQRLHVFTAQSYDDMYRVAMAFGEHLNIGVYDCSGDENVWIKEKPVT